MDKELFNLNLVEKARRAQEERELQHRLNMKSYLAEEANADILDIKRKRMDAKNSRIQAPSAIREALVYAFVDKMYTTTLENMKIEDTNGIRYNMINNYLAEYGVTSIVKEYSEASEFLSEVAYQINSHAKKILEEKLEDSDGGVIKITIDDQQKSDFLDSLDTANIDQLSKKIAMRVQQAQVDFLHYNQIDKEEIEEIINITQEKVGSTVKESLITLYENDCKRAIDRIRLSRPKTILEVMVNQICKETYNNDLLKEQFLTEDSKLDIGSVLETAQIMYTFLEMCNTVKLVKVDEAYINKVYSEITQR